MNYIRVANPDNYDKKGALFYTEPTYSAFGGGSDTHSVSISLDISRVVATDKDIHPYSILRLVLIAY